MGPVNSLVVEASGSKLFVEAFCELFSGDTAKWFVVSAGLFAVVLFGFVLLIAGVRVTVDASLTAGASITVDA